MKIRYLSPEGVLEVEQSALLEIHRQLPGHWLAYAAFQLVPRNSSNPLDVDLVVITTNRVLIVELKNWKGDIEYSEGQWFHKDGAHKSPVLVTANKVRVLEGVLKQKLGGKQTPIVNFVVVLCHPKCRLVGFPEEEKKYTLTLSEFCSVYSNQAKYIARHADVPGRPSPLDDRGTYESIFSFKNPQLRERKLVFHGFKQLSTRPDYVHPRALWEEFRAEHVEVKRSQALLRKWNFQALSDGGTTAAERETIGLREMNLNERLRVQAPELHEDTLAPIAPATAQDLTTNFIEGYRLPERAERLFDFLARRPDLEPDERIDITRVVLSRFASLHLLGIAHRDITTKTLWIVEPARIVLSTFAAARMPEAQTVGAHRVELETGSVKLPEDVSGDGRNVPDTTEFARDVFLLGCIAFELIEGQQLELVSDVPMFDDKAALQEPRLREWFSKSLEWEPGSRYRSAQEALDSFNAFIDSGQMEIVKEEEIETYRTELSPLSLPPKEKLKSLPGKVVYRSELGGRDVLVKCWPALTFDARKPARNARVLSFLQQARSLRQSGFDATPQVLEFGTSDMGLMLVTAWEPGETLLSWNGKAPSSEECAELALSLLNAVRRLHASGMCHGDLKPSNVLVANALNGKPKAILLDIPDLSADGDEGLTPGNLPAALEGAAPQHRDSYIAIELALALLDDKFQATRAEARKELANTEVIPPLDLLADTLQAELNPPAVLLPEYAIKVKGRRNEGDQKRELVGDDNVFPVGVQHLPEKNEVLFYVTGLRQQLVVKCRADSQQTTEVFVKEISHDGYVTAARRSAFRLNAVLYILRGEDSDASPLIEVLVPRYEATRQDSTETPNERPQTARDPYTERSLDGANKNPASTHALWEALTTTDELNAFLITLREGARRTPEDDWLVPYDSDDATIDFADEEKIEVLERGADPIDGTERWFVVGTVKDLGRDLLQVTPSSFRFSARQGKQYYLRGSLERFASEKRVAAMRRVLGGGALIPNLTTFFEPGVEAPPREYVYPSLEDLEKYALNPLQAEALQIALRYGPVSLLQGPPGTGKTKFIASFVHHVLSTNSVKNVLLVSQSHDAVNNALQKVRELAATTELAVSVVRVGLASMVPDSLRPVQEDAKRQAYREKFAAEMKERIRFVGAGMGLPRAYVDTAIDVRTSLGDILDRIEHLEGSLDDEHREAATLNHLRELRERFFAIAESKFDWAVERQGNLRAQLDEFLDVAAKTSGSPSPDKRRRLDVVARLSTEFAHVLRNPRSNFTAFLARSAQLVSGTCVGVGKHSLGIVDGAYDWVIVDEAARASPMELVVAMQAGRRILLVGDHLQLPPTYSLTVQDKTAQILGISRSEFRGINSFQRAFFSSYGKQVGRTLLKQYRMAHAINRVVSNCFYDRALEVGREPPGPEYGDLPPYMRREVAWVDTADFGKDSFHRAAGQPDEGALVNEVEANLVVNVVRDIVKNRKLVDHVRGRGESEPLVGVITMYAAQRDLIRRKFDQSDWASDARDLFTVGTVDSYQGKENRVIVLSIVRNNSEAKIGFLSEPERINVALSRAKDRLFIVGSTAMWAGRKMTPLHRVLRELQQMENEGLAAFVLGTQLKSSAYADETTV